MRAKKKMHVITAKGKSLPISAWSKLTGLSVRVTQSATQGNNQHMIY